MAGVNVAWIAARSSPIRRRQQGRMLTELFQFIEL